jgi:phosphoribosyl-ATP pyrophosphohydrolase
LPEGSYVSKLHTRGVGYISQKVVEEAGESIVAALEDKPDELTGEVADLLFHLTVLLREKGLNLQDIASELARRHQ